jgi:soluble lytic murein transglycosylase-like protein
MGFSQRPAKSRRRVTLIGVAAMLAFAAAPLHAGSDADQADSSDTSITSAVEPKTDTPEASAVAAREFPARAAVRALIEKETAKTGLPADIAEAVVFVESRYDSSVIGRVGEVGLMQVRPETAAMLGFRGTNAELAEPRTNIHYGVSYLSRAWRLAQGDLCRALMKYRAGHGEETMTPRSVIYCNRARNRLIAMNSPYASATAVASLPPEVRPASVVAVALPAKKLGAPSPVRRPSDVYAIYKQGTPAASRAFWTAQEARVRAIKTRLEQRWRSASR